ncbi:ATP-binding cassette domain-containing protein [Brucella intermedia]|uniref:ATP-binding cassette domain-containing protein n=1 Tax=Brucella intermedia TaxID=94625 RepID=UPI003B642518
MSQNKPIVRLHDVNVCYGNYHAVGNVTIDNKKGEVVVIVGPSGAGKSTFLRTINMLAQRNREFRCTFICGWQ